MSCNRNISTSRSKIYMSEERKIEIIHMNSPICEKCLKGFDESDPDNMCKCVMSEEEIKKAVDGFMDFLNGDHL